MKFINEVRWPLSDFCSKNIETLGSYKIPPAQLTIVRLTVDHSNCLAVGSSWIIF